MIVRPASRVNRPLMTAAYCLVVVVLCCSAMNSALGQGSEDAGDGAVVLFNEGQELHEKGDLKGAISLYKRALEIVPEFPEAEYQCGAAYLSLKMPAEAEAAFKRAVELRPDWTLALTSLGSLLLENGKLTEAEATLKTALELEEGNPPALAAFAELKLRTRAKPDVLSSLLIQLVKFTEKAKPTVALWNARAAVELALDKKAAARNSLERSLALDTNNIYAITELSNSALLEGDRIKAAEFVATLEKLAPNSVNARLQRARIHLANDRKDEAAALLDTIKSDTRAAQLLKDIAASSEQDPADLEKSLAADPKDAIALGRLCNLYRLPDPAKALEYCRRASEADPLNVNHAIGYGAALVQSKQFDQAIFLFRKLLTAAGDNSTLHANLATAFFQSKRYAEAKTEYLWLTAKQPNLVAAYYFLAITHDQLGEYADAMANYQIFIKKADRDKNLTEIEKVELRLPALQKLIRGKR